MQDLERLNMAEGEHGIKKPIVMPDVFKGDIEEDWEDWIESFKACADINSWDDNLKCKFLGVRVKGTAYKVYQDLETAVKLDWKELCKTLEKRFKTVKQPQFYKTKFLGLKQEQNETILDLGNKIRTLARKAYPEIDAQLRDELARDQFVRALTNIDMTLKLRHNMPDTLDDAIRMAIDWQTVEIDVRKDKKVIFEEKKEPTTEGVKSGEACVAATQESSLMSMMAEVLTLIKEDREEARRNRGQYNVGRGRGRMRNENNLRCYVCGSDRHLKRYCPKNNVCWNCELPGHTKNNCPNLKQTQSGNGK